MGVLFTNVLGSLGRHPDTHPAARSLPLLRRAGGENTKKNLVGRDKHREITYQLASREKQTRLRKINLIHCQLK